MSESVALGYAFAVGAASFFSPCSVGLLPAYVSYFLATREVGPSSRTWVQSALRGVGLGVSGSAGFLVLFLLLALLFRFVPLPALAPLLPYVSIAIGGIIVLLGVLLLQGRDLSLSLPNPFLKQSRTSIFAFGFAYALASLGCTFPLFVSVVLVAFATGDPLEGARNLVAYALGMASVMTTLTTALAISKEKAKRAIHQAIPIVQKASSLVLVVAGIYVIYYWVQSLGALS